MIHVINDLIQLDAIPGLTAGALVVARRWLACDGECRVLVIGSTMTIGRGARAFPAQSEIRVLVDRKPIRRWTETELNEIASSKHIAAPRLARLYGCTPHQIQTARAILRKRDRVVA